MFLKKLDILSPYITLHFKGEKKHSSKFSVLLSVITYVIASAAGIYYIIDFINKNEPKAYFSNRYIEDAGEFPLNSSSMFNFIQICNEENNEPIPFDYSKIRVIGSNEVFYDDYMNDPSIILNKNHWLYGYCNNDTDTEGIGYLINFKNYEKSSCIRKFYDKNTKKYYNTDEKGFKWPILEKGCSHPNRTFYGIILQRCDKVPDLIKSQDLECSSEQEITNNINKISLNFEIIDNYPDILNYKIPLTKYFYTLTSAITNGIYIVNHLNFNPVNILSHNGIFFDNVVKEHSHIFVQNEKHTIHSSSLPQGKSTNGCLIGIYFWMQNTLQYYERVYNRLQDTLSDIGGIYSVVFTAAYILNLFVHNYIIVLDTEDLVINRDKKNFTESNRGRRPTIFRNANRFMYPPRRRYMINKKNNIEKNCQEELNVSNNQNIFKIKKRPEIIMRNYKENNMNNNINIYLDNLGQRDNMSHIFAKDNTKIINYNGRNNNNENNSIEIHSERKGINNEINNKEKKIVSLNEELNQDNLIDIDNRPIGKINFNFIKYLYNLINCGKHDKRITYYESFRAKLISEESVIQNYLDIYKLLDSYKIYKKSNINEKYESYNNYKKYYKGTSKHLDNLKN